MQTRSVSSLLPLEHSAGRNSLLDDFFRKLRHRVTLALILEDWRVSRRNLLQPSFLFPCRVYQLEWHSWLFHSPFPRGMVECGSGIAAQQTLSSTLFSLSLLLRILLHVWPHSKRLLPPRAILMGKCFPSRPIVATHASHVFQSLY